LSDPGNWDEVMRSKQAGPMVNCMPHYYSWVGREITIWGDISSGNYEWDLGDGTILNDVVTNSRYIEVTHAYVTGDIKTATLTVTDDNRKIDADQTTITADYGPPSEPNTWEKFTIPLTASTFGVDPLIFQQVLANVQQFRIKTEMHYGSDIGSIDSVKIGNVYLSTFDNGTEGWSAAGDGTMQWIPDGGYYGGYLQISDWATGDWHWTVAPVEWAEDWTGLIGSNIEFYFKTDHPSLSAVVEITSDETKRLILSADPLIIPQNGTSLMRVTLSHISTEDVIVSLNSSNTNCITVPSEAVVLANDAFVEFTIYAAVGAVVGSNSVITASATDYGVSRITLSIGEGISPTADFTTDVTSGDAPLEVNFEDLSTQGTGEIIEWKWYFGDGDSSFVQNPSHIYDNPGIYTVSLTVTDVYDSNDTETKIDYINVLGTEEPYFRPNPFNPEFYTGEIFPNFDEPTSPVTKLRIYDIAGELVKERDDVGNISMLWDGKNEYGDYVANGVYFIIVENQADEKKIIKVAILR
jgi:PKD repeat protein